MLFSSGRLRVPVINNVVKTKTNTRENAIVAPRYDINTPTLIVMLIRNTRPMPNVKVDIIVRVGGNHKLTFICGIMLMASTMQALSTYGYGGL